MMSAFIYLFITSYISESAERTWTFWKPFDKRDKRKMAAVLPTHFLTKDAPAPGHVFGWKSFFEAHCLLSCPTKWSPKPYLISHFCLCQQLNTLPFWWWMNFYERTSFYSGISQRSRSWLSNKLCGFHLNLIYIILKRDYIIYFFKQDNFKSQTLISLHFLPPTYTSPPPPSSNTPPISLFLLCCEDMQFKSNYDN